MRIQHKSRKESPEPASAIDPVPHKTRAWHKLEIFCGLAVFGFSLALYIWTLAPTVKAGGQR